MTNTLESLPVRLNQGPPRDHGWTAPTQPRMLSTMPPDELLAFALRSSTRRDVALPRLSTLVLVKSGGAAVFDGKAWHPARGGDAAFLHAAEHIRLTDAASEVICFARPADPGDGDAFVLPASRLADDPRCRSLVALLHHEAAATAVTDHLVEAFLLCARQLGGLRPVERTCRDEQIHRAIELVTSDLSRRWTVSALAKAVGLSRSAFSRRFREALATSPEQYFTGRRLDHAAQRVVWSDEGLAAIAAAVGYQSPFAFNRAFKRHHGLTPGSYRRRWRRTLRGDRDRIRMVAVA